MNRGRRAVLMWTGLAVAVLAGVLSFLSWDRADQVAGVVSAVVGVAALGVGVYGALGPPRGPDVQVSGTGRAVSRGGGEANTGFVSPAPTTAPGSVSVSDTGDAEADGGGANTGFRQG
ncbi:hypothetical protein K7395_21380 [Streptomyces filamentosus]|uniref:Secreted protein n=1 Tax=Streptomyces filamentosus TaxID=67294 RepID=A0ABY4V352_STRFL|nr:MULTISPECIES: hypothetical protein [Streptomyces]ESU48607.1 hypothetical protein P376_3413 [Streptomyces sp. HCCB10043]USC49094.1 hypothetical protein K7395_21380 [Streptomyces filamentosus]